jgi:hypothetical protein
MRRCNPQTYNLREDIATMPLWLDDFFRWGHGRRPLLNLTVRLPRNGGWLEAMKDSLLSFLYPEDAEVEFPAKPVQ